MARHATGDQRITRSDLETAFGSFLGETSETARASVPQAAVVGGAVALGILTLTFLAGRRRGRRRSAVIEIRRA